MFGMFLSAASQAAADYTSVTTAMTGSFETLVTNTVAMLAAVLPVGITIFGMYMLIGFAKKIFKKITG